MLGWEIFIRRERDGVTLASWLVGHSGLDWIRQLQRQGKATCIEEGGYPTKFTLLASVVLPVLSRREVPPHDSHEMLGDDYYLPAKFSADFRLHEDEVAKCKPGDMVVIEAWDQS